MFNKHKTKPKCFECGQMDLTKRKRKASKRCIGCKHYYEIRCDLATFRECDLNKEDEQN